MLTTDEKLKFLAKAILELAGKSAKTWDFDGEQIVSSGVDLSDERRLREIAGDTEPAGRAAIGGEKP